MKQTSQDLVADKDVEDIAAKTPITLEEIFSEIGAFGPYQIAAGLSTGFVMAFGSFIVLNFIFGADIPEHRWVY